MSLLDNVSIVVTPNGYKAGELYAVVPVPTEGAEEITDGTFPSGTSVWSEGTGWSLVDGYANASSASGELSQSGLDFDTSKRYYIQYTISGYSGSGGVTARFKGLVWNTGVLREENGTFTEVLMSTAENTVFTFVTSSSFTGSISNVSVKEYTAADMDVTRATAATRVDEDGLVNYAEILGSEEVIDSSFPSDTTAWEVTDGTVTFNNEAIFDINSKIRQNIFDIDKVYKFTYEVTENTGGMTLRFYNGAAYTFVDNSVGIHTVYLTATSTTYFYISTLSGTSLTLKSVSVKEVTRDNVPRIDYTGGGCPHILAEPERTNLITYSEDFSQSYWTKQSGVTPTYNTTETLSPDGTYNATKFIGNGSSGVFKSNINITGVVTRSVYLKSVTGTVNVVLKDPNQTITSKSLTVTTEWQRFDLTEDNTTSLQGIWIDDIPVSGIYMWGAQLEAGSYPTSYIPTSGSTVTRVQDIFTRDGIGSLINSTEGVLFAEMAALSDDETNREITLSDGTGSNYVLIRFNSGGSNRIYTRVDVGGALEYYDLNTSHTITNNNKIAIRWGASNFATFINGVEAGSQLSGSSFSADTLNNLSFDNGGGGNKFFGKVKQLQVYKTALTDEQLTSLTS